MGEMPVLLQKERDRLVEEIKAAFANVTREGGISWSESDVVDAYGSKDQRARAREIDRDLSWTELVDDESWEDSPGVGGWSFLDAIGFRYYLPAAMLRQLHGKGVDAFPFHLTLSKWFLADYTRSQWSLLDERQARCVRDFV